MASIYLHLNNMSRAAGHIQHLTAEVRFAVEVAAQEAALLVSGHYAVAEQSDAKCSRERSKEYNN